MDFISMFPVVIFMISVVSRNAQAQSNSFDITKYGAKPGADATEAMASAFKAACAATSPSVVVIPKGTFILNPADYLGPCKAPIKYVIEGTLQQPKGVGEAKECWLNFRHVQGLSLTGSGVLDGRGEDRWGQPQCAKNKKQDSCRSKLKNVCLFAANNSLIEGITSLNSKGGHLNIYGCSNNTIQNVNITAPDNSPNTDGIHFGTCNGVIVRDSEIGTGDDCIGIVDNVQNLKATNIQCGPGHGISIGSLGLFPNGKPVSGIHVENCTFKGTSNGVRIKSWPGKNTNTVSDVTFINNKMENVSTAITIDQTYGTCTINEKCSASKEEATVVLDNIVIKGIKGTTSQQEAIILNCLSGGCKGLTLGDIDLKFTRSGRAKIKAAGGGGATARCLNVKPQVTGTMNPPCKA